MIYSENGNDEEFYEQNASRTSIIASKVDECVEEKSSFKARCRIPTALLIHAGMYAEQADESTQDKKKDSNISEMS